MVYISKKLRAYVTERAREQCEYCQTQMKIVVEMQIDHIIPTSKGGETIDENLCLACGSCNLAKGAFLDGYDTTTDNVVSLFNPRTHVWSEHFQWDSTETQILGLTPIGRATIARLDINRKGIVNARKLWKQAGWHPPSN